MEKFTVPRLAITFRKKLRRAAPKIVEKDTWEKISDGLGNSGCSG
jgi:hypothetical protein